MIRFKFIDDHRAVHSVKRICQVIKVCRSSYYKWKATATTRAARSQSDAALGAKISTVFAAEKGLYGAKRITAVLNAEADAQRTNHKRVARIMKALGLAGFKKKRRVTTTKADPARRVFPDLVKRCFTAAAPNRLMVGDITYLPVTGGSNLYLATVIDCYSRRLIGFSIADHMRQELVADALTSARNNRGDLRGAIFHTDHGSVYTSKAFQDHCVRLGVTQSMGAVGTSADNALAESFNAALKREVLRDRKCFGTADEARREVFAWCVRYNRGRRHSWCNYATPIEFENLTRDTMGLAA